MECRQKCSSAFPICSMVIPVQTRPGWAPSSSLSRAPFDGAESADIGSASGSPFSGPCRLVLILSTTNRPSRSKIRLPLHT